MSNAPQQLSRSSNDSQASRRQFIKGSTAGLVGGALASQLGTFRAAHAASNDTLKVGLIGCGGRGSGAAGNAMRADANVKLVAMADAFSDRVESSKQGIQKQLEAEGLQDKFAVEDDHCFAGLDAYQQLLEADVDVVILAATPQFRPRHLKAAIEAGKHVFCEKPVAVDAPGVRSVLETTEQARAKNLNLVSGLCWRYDARVRETVNRVLDGAIGDILAIQSNYLTGTLWHRGRKPEWSELEYQIRNWLYFTWLSGDHIVEQHIHSLDKALWLNHDELPNRCFGLGGRQVRTDEKWGNIYDHHAVCYEYDSGVKVFAYTRQMGGCYNDVDDYVLGSNGNSRLLKFSIESGSDRWRWRGPAKDMYNAEHEALFAAIRSGETINNGIYMARSTMMAIMGRMACYTGKLIESDAALNSEESLTPETYQWGDVPVPPVAMPGIG